jgi:Fe-S-cluster-containing dehydrogenase component
MDKRIFVVANELCNGCRNCEMWCSFTKARKNEFNPVHSRIKIVKDAEGKMNIPTVDCNGRGCVDNEKREPICVEMCPTGTLIYSDIQDLIKKRLELEEKRNVQPLFRLIAPWKYPYPWKEWPKEGF